MLGTTIGSCVVLLGKVGSNELGHLEGVYGILAKDGCEFGVAKNLTLVALVLEVIRLDVCPQLLDDSVAWHLVTTADFGELGREDERPVERVVGVGSPLLAGLVVIVFVASSALLCGFLLGLWLGLWFGAVGWWGGFGGCGFGRSGFGGSGGSGGGSRSVTTSYTSKTGKSEATGGGSGRSAIVRVRRLWWSGHAFGDLVEAVTDDFVDLLFACGKVECWRESVWW